MSVVHVHAEERRESHRKLWNKGKIQQTFKIGNVVKEHVQLHSNVEQGNAKTLK